MSTTWHFCDFINFYWMFDIHNFDLLSLHLLSEMNWKICNKCQIFMIFTWSICIGCPTRINSCPIWICHFILNNQCNLVYVSTLFFIGYPMNIDKFLSDHLTKISPSIFSLIGVSAAFVRSQHFHRTFDVNDKSVNPCS